jgi:hypothetical protein
MERCTAYRSVKAINQIQISQSNRSHTNQSKQTHTTAETAYRSIKPIDHIKISQSNRSPENPPRLGQITSDEQPILVDQQLMSKIGEPEISEPSDSKENNVVP